MNFFSNARSEYDHENDHDNDHEYDILFGGHFLWVYNTKLKKILLSWLRQAAFCFRNQNIHNQISKIIYLYVKNAHSN
jgi:hypothetical protein